MLYSQQIEEHYKKAVTTDTCRQGVPPPFILPALIRKLNRKGYCSVQVLHTSSWQCRPGVPPLLILPALPPSSLLLEIQVHVVVQKVWIMIKALTLVFVCLGEVSVCHADGHAIPVLISAPDSSNVQTVAGTVDAVSLADRATGQRCEIVIADQNGQQHVLIVKATTTMYDQAWKPIGLDMLRKSDSVKAKYVITGEGLTEALSIKKYSK